MENPHVLVVPFPAYGHITPLLELSQTLQLQHALKITLVLPQKLISSLPTTDKIRLVSILDDENTHIEEFAFKIMPKKVEKLIVEEINGFDCVIVDFLLGWGVHVAAECTKMKRAVFSGNMAAGLVLISKIPTLIDDGVIDEHGMIFSHLTL